MAPGGRDHGVRRRARSFPGGDQRAGHAALILFPSQSARRRLRGTLFEKACLIRREWGPTGQSRGHRQLLLQSDGGPRLMGRNHSLFRTLSQAGEAPGRVPGRSLTFTPLRTRALRASVAGRVPGSYGGSSAVASPCGWNPRLAGPGYPARKGEAHPSLVHTPIPDFWVANPFPSLGSHFTWPGAAGGFADYPPSAGFIALPTLFRALGALTFWQVALERMLGANSRSGSTGSARYRP